MKTFFLLLILISFNIGCSKKGQSATIQPPANSTNITVNITFPDGRSFSSVDYSLPVGVTNQVDGATDTLVPVGWVDTNNLEYGWEFWTYGFMGLTAGKSYSLYFSTPTYYDNASFEEVYNPLVYSPTLAYAAGTTLGFKFQGSTYNIPKAIVTTGITDSTQSPTNGSFTISLFADSVFTGATRSVYSYSSPIVITGTFNNVIYR
jgi:hypothetical protein